MLTGITASNALDHLGRSYGSAPAESTLEVINTLEELRERVPEQLYEMAAQSPQGPEVEELDV